MLLKESSVDNSPLFTEVSRTEFQYSGGNDTHRACESTGISSLNCSPNYTFWSPVSKLS
jgi:hypothetical protein